MRIQQYKCSNNYFESFEVAKKRFERSLEYFDRDSEILGDVLEDEREEKPDVSYFDAVVKSLRDVVIDENYLVETFMIALKTNYDVMNEVASKDDVEALALIKEIEEYFNTYQAVLSLLRDNENELKILYNNFSSRHLLKVNDVVAINFTAEESGRLMEIHNYYIKRSADLRMEAEVVFCKCWEYVKSRGLDLDKLQSKVLKELEVYEGAL